MSTVENTWKDSEDPANVRSLVYFGVIAYMGKLVRGTDQVTLGGELKKRIGAMETLAGRLTGSFRGLVGNVIFILLAAAVIIFVFWLSSLRDNFYAVTHTREREADRAALREEQKEAKHHIDVLLSQTETCSKLYNAGDKNMLDKLFAINSKASRDVCTGVLRDSIKLARIYYQYANSEIDRVVNKVR